MNQYQHFQNYWVEKKQNFREQSIYQNSLKACLSRLLSETFSLPMPTVAQLEVKLAALSYVQCFLSVFVQLNQEPKK